MKAIAMIPARGGSKRVPRKNVRLLGGQPLISYSIAAALRARSVDRVIVNTDDDEIASVAAEAGAEVQRRPAELATDSAKTIGVVRHALGELATQGNLYPFVVLLQPTSPFRQPSQIDKAVELYDKHRCDSVVSHIRVDYFHPNRMKSIKNGKIVPYCEPEVENIPRSALRPAYYRDGSIYGFRWNLPLETDSLMGEDIRPIITNRDYFVNIDEERDWIIAEHILESNARLFDFWG
ncbi:MAG: acylneuraminate cytidylyltransferase family protein [Chloroflexota bacterium]